jgi:hypothetical protein
MSPAASNSAWTVAYTFRILFSAHGSWGVKLLSKSQQLCGFLSHVLVKAWRAMNSSWCLWSIPFLIDSAAGHTYWGVITQFLIFVFHRSSASGSLDSPGGIATGYGLDDRGVEVRVPEGSRVFHSARRPDSLDSSVGIATGYGLDGRGVGVRVLKGSRIFSSPRCPHWLWGPHNLLTNGYRGLFLRG